MRVKHGDATVPRTSQLMRLVRETLDDALRIDCDDERFDEIRIVRVEPLHGTRRLLVVYAPTRYRPAEAGDEHEVQRAFEGAKTRLEIKNGP